MQRKALERYGDVFSNDENTNCLERFSGSRKRNRDVPDVLATLHITPKRSKGLGTLHDEHINQCLVRASKFPFFSLPREIRDEIYHFALCGLHVTFKHHSLKITACYTDNHKEIR
jgi:hypothetical protein